VSWTADVWRTRQLCHCFLCLRYRSVFFSIVASWQNIFTSTHQWHLFSQVHVCNLSCWLLLRLRWNGYRLKLSASSTGNEWMSMTNLARIQKLQFCSELVSATVNVRSRWDFALSSCVVVVCSRYLLNLEMRPFACVPS